MPRNYQALEVNAFSKGIMTAASPLTYPEGTALKIDNFNLNRDGSLSRRFGLKDVSSALDTNSVFLDKSALTNVFEWDGAGGVPNSRLLVVQDGTIARVFDRTAEDMAAAEIGTFNVSTDPSIRVTFVSVDDYLITATGNKTLIRTSFDGDSKERTLIFG